MCIYSPISFTKSICFLLNFHLLFYTTGYRLELYDLENESDSTYKDLVHNEMIFIRKQREKIISNAKVMYNQKVSNDTTAGYVKSALDFQALEVLCDKYETIDSSLYPVV